MDCILLTGGAGYFGSVLAQRLLDGGFQVRVFDSLRAGGAALLGLLHRRGCQFVQADLRRPADVARALHGIDAVVHLAALVGEPACRQSPRQAWSVNLEATRTLFRLSRRHRIKRFLFASTCSVYGIRQGGVACDERMAAFPTSLYSRTKIAAERFLMGQTIGPRRVIFRFSTLFGLSSAFRWNLLLQDMVKGAHLKKNVRLFEPMAWRPLLHVQDAASAVISTLQAPIRKNCDLYNVGGEDLNVQKRWLAKRVQRWFSSRIVESRKKFDDSRNYRVSFDKIRRRFGFRPQFSIDDGLRELKWALKSGIITCPD